MKEKLVTLVGNKLEGLGVYVYDVLEEREAGNNYLRVVLDSDDIIDIDKVVAATKIIDPIVEKADFMNNKYILDVYARSKGDD